MHKKDIRTAGKKIAEAKNALIMLHGRGAPAEDILGLSSHLSVNDFALIAPQATNYTWYPYSFLVPPQQNEPWLSSALELLNEVVSDINKAGISAENIFFAGFSQGACLTLEYVTRHARKWGGVAAFTGGLIGDKLYPENYQGDFEGTPVFIGSSNPDPHIPVERVLETTKILKAMNASVNEKIYPGMGHTISESEIKLANAWVFNAGV
ncbi:MAG: dienelactone hydrolase family protein [Cyclobacteriaceae bacterium]